MPEDADPAVYRYRAKRWREQATKLPEDDPERPICLELAEGYERLADLLEEQRRKFGGTKAEQ
jgi:hypothetical protein